MSENIVEPRDPMIGLARLVVACSDPRCLDSLVEQVAVTEAIAFAEDDRQPVDEATRESFARAARLVAADINHDGPLQQVRFLVEGGIEADAIEAAIRSHPILVVYYARTLKGRIKAWMKFNDIRPTAWEVRIKGVIFDVLDDAKAHDPFIRAAEWEEVLDSDS
jgi:hypothetical protein